MKKSPAKHLIFIVDDNKLFLKSLELSLENMPDTSVTSFDSGESCLESLGEKPDMIVLDFHLDGVNPSAMNGLETLEQIKKKNPETPVIILSSQDKIEVAVLCMQQQANDYIVKSETAFIRLRRSISTILKAKTLEKHLLWYQERV